MLSEQEDRLARLAVEKHYLTRNQLTDCVSYKRDLAPTVPLHQLLIDQGYLTFEEVEELLGQSSDTPLFATLLREQGLATEAQIRDALTRKQELATRNIHRYLGEILVEKGVISPEQVNQILAQQGKKSLVCKACGYRYNSRHGSGYACPECNRPISEVQASVPDDRVGRFVLQEELGRGRTGVVHRAIDPARGEKAAVKIISGHAFSRPYLDRCLSRARDLSLITHPNLATVLEAGRYGQAIYIASEYVEGLTLRDHVTGNMRLPLDEAIAILKQVTAGIQAAHQRDLLHGNLTPENVLITELREVMMTDLGLGREMAGLPLEELETLGSLMYAAAPERWNRRPSAASDLYSCGCLWYYMLTGVQPFQASTVQEVKRRHMKVTPPLPSKHVPELPNGADAIALKLLRKEPSVRYRHATELLADLDRLEIGETTEAENEIRRPSAPTRPRKSPPRRSRRR